MPRLFTGLEIPGQIGQHLALLRGGLPGARWIDVENYHITLRFLGDVDDRLAGEVDELLSGVRRGPLELSIDGLDVFGGDRPRALIAKVAPTPDLMELQAEHERIARRVGLPAEGRKYSPHVTLARLRNVSARTAADWLAMHGGGGPRQSFSASRFVLFSSRASTGGGPYLVEAEYELV